MTDRSPEDVRGRRRYTTAEAAAAAKPRDAWIIVLVADQAAIPLTRLLANRTPITPNQVTAAWGLLYAAAAGAFLMGSARWLWVGATLFLSGFLLDRVDGKLAWLTERRSDLGAWLDSVMCRCGFVLCALALLVGRYVREHDESALLLAVIVVSAESLRDMLERFRPPAPALSPQSRTPFGRWRERLARYGLRARPVSQAELMLLTCVAAPLTGWYAPLIGAGAALVVLFELAAGCEPWLATQQRRDPGLSGPIEVLLPMPSLRE